MNKLNLVSKKLGVSKGKIKNMVKDGLVTFDLTNGVYYVDENDVKERLRINQEKKQNSKEVIDSVIYDWKNDTKGNNKTYKEIFKQQHKSNGISYDELNILSYMNNSLSLYYEGGEYQFNPIDFGKYGIVLVKDMINIKDGIYFTNQTYSDFIIASLANNHQHNDFNDIAKYSQTECLEYLKKNNILHLTINEFIKEFTPSKYYKKILNYSKYLETKTS